MTASGDTEGKSVFSLTPKRYASFLKTAFGYYYDDFKSGKYISVREFDNFVMLAQGRMAECCGMNGVCPANLVIEADGGAYPCDFYVLDEWKCGNIIDNSVEEIFSSDNARKFRERSYETDDKCLRCRYYVLCRGGCARYRGADENGKLLRQKNACESYIELLRLSAQDKISGACASVPQIKETYKRSVSMLVVKSELMDESAVRRTLTRMTHEIIEKNKGTENLCLVGIKRRGVPLSHILAENIKKFEKCDVPVGYIDITLYRDDLSETNELPKASDSSLPFDISGKAVVLVDDVIYTGRTARAAIEAVFSYGRPAAIQLAVLIDRGHRELPIRPDFVGKNIPTSKGEIVCSVMVEEFDGVNAVRILEKKD